MTGERQCTAKLSNGSRQCRNAAIRGGVVCRYHGGAAPQVQASARERLDALVDPAITGLQTALDSEDLGAVLKAARLVLDRAGFPPATKLEIETQRVRLVEEQGQMIVRVIAKSLTDLGIDFEDRDVRKVVAQHLRLGVAEEEGGICSRSQTGGRLE